MGEYIVAFAYTTKVNADNEKDAIEKAKAELKNNGGLNELKHGCSMFKEHESINSFTEGIHTVDAVVKAIGYEKKKSDYVNGVMTNIYKNESDLSLVTEIMEDWGEHGEEDD